MSYAKRLVVLAFFGLFCTLGLTANAQSVPLLAVPPVASLGLVPYGNTGNGITDVVTWTTGAGSAATTDSFANNYFGPTAVQGTGGFGFPLFDGWGCGLSGIPAAFGSWGPFQAGLGGNWGAQNSAATGFSEATSFGLQPFGLAFGVPVPAGGLVFT